MFKAFVLIFIVFLGSASDVFAARNITSITVDGGSSTTVTASANVTMVVNVTTTGGGSTNDWESTAYTIDSNTVCIDHGDYTTSGSYSESFSITAPVADGSYDLTVVAYQNDSCSVGGDTETLLNAITVSAGGISCVTFRDEFSTESYARNDGTANWATSWDEVGDNDNASNGDIEINNNRLQLEGGGSASNSLGGPYIQREANLSGYTSATFSFDYSERGNWEGNDDMEVYVSSNGGSSWTLIQTFTNDQSPDTFSQDISSYIASDTRIAFVEKADSGNDNEDFFIDNVQIEACAPSGPAVSAITRDMNETNSLDVVSWTVTFTEAVTGVEASDFQLAVSGLVGATITGVTGSGDAWTVTASTGTGTGTVGLNLVDNDSIINASNEPLGGSGTGNGNFTGEVYNISDTSCVTFRDEFSSQSYSNNDGTASWLTDWVENELSGSSPSSGFIEILNSPQVLEIRGGKSIFGGDTADQTITRSADLSGYTSATITFDYAEYFSAASEYNEDYVSIEVRQGSGPWIELARYRDDAGSGSASLDISSYIDANTQVRFFASGVLNGPTFFAEYIHFDNFQIEACSSGPVDPPVVADGFNCIHTAAIDSVDGRLYTRIVDSAFTVDVAALKTDETLETDYASDEDRDVTLQLVEGDCSTPVSLAQTLTFVDADDGRKQSALITVSRAYSNVKCLVTDVSEATSYCSTDSFAIRPASLTLSTPTLNNAGFSGTPKAVAGSNFSLEVTTVPGYTGTPSVDVTAIDSLPSPGATGTLVGSFGAATTTVSASTSTGSFTYSEVGNFQFQDYAIRDENFTSIDQTTDCIDNSYSNALDVDGKVGCDFGYAGMTDWVGRFTPNHFDITNTNGMLVNNCGTSFSYTGTEIGFSTDPMITITAKNLAGDTTLNYTGNYAYLTGSGSFAVSTSSPAVFPVASAQFTVAATDNSTTGAVSGNVSLTWDDSSALDDSADSFLAATGANGIFTTYFSGLTINYDKVSNNIVAPFTPDTTLAATLQVNDGDDVVSSSVLSITPQDNVSNPVLVHYGRLNLLNAYGSELQTLPMTMQVEYYAGSATDFVPNTDDSCTVINDVVITDIVADDLSVNETCIWDATGDSGSFNCAMAGDAADQYSSTPIASNFNLNLMGPGAGNTGVLNVIADAPTHLEYDWNGTGLSDPTGTASFGIHNRESQTIFLKEVR